MSGSNADNRTSGDSRPDTPARDHQGSQGGEAPSDLCDIRERTLLNSPNRAVLSTLRVDDRLKIELQSGPPQRLLAKQGDETAGSITSLSHMQIIQCILSKNRQYVAIVRSIRDGRCDVMIEPI